MTRYSKRWGGQLKWSRSKAYLCAQLPLIWVFALTHFALGTETPGSELFSVERHNCDNRRQRELEAENRALRKQLAEKDEVISVLKKSVGILSAP